MTGAYRVQELSRKEMAACDPFGNGVFLSVPGKGRDEIIEALAERLGMIVPAVAWDGIGAWIDLEGTGMNAQEIKARWGESG